MVRKYWYGVRTSIGGPAAIRTSSSRADENQMSKANVEVLVCPPDLKLTGLPLR